MNVVSTEKPFQPPLEKRRGPRQRVDPNVPVTKHPRRSRSNRRAGCSNLSKSSRYPSVGRGRAVGTSSSLVTSTVNARTKFGTRTTAATGSSVLESAAGATVLAITTGRGDARSEVGIAALDMRCSHLILCQISDSQTYVNALSKLYLFDPTEVLMPDTLCDRAGSKAVLYRTIVDQFPELAITEISRIHFNDTSGLERIKYLSAAEYSSVELFVKQKYYALAAAAALFKYVEYAQRIVYTPKSMKIEFHGSPNATAIDLESARSLELVQSQCGQRNVSLIGIMDRCSTPMGRKLMRTNILQPPCKEDAILERQTAVAELASNRALPSLIQPIVRQLYGADRLLALSASSVPYGSSVQCAEHNLSYVLLLKNLLDVVPELARILSDGESELFRKIRKKLEREEFRLMRERILETVHPDARSVAGYTSSNMQRCFAIKAGINDLLDIARQTYCELIDDTKTMAESLASKYKLPLSLSCNASLGYHIQMVPPRNSRSESVELPTEFIEVRRSKRMCTMTTSALATLSQQCKIACEELHLMSNVLLCDLLEGIRSRIGCLFELSADVAELDLVTSLAELSSLRGYTRPTFGPRLQLLDSRHPVMEIFGTNSPVPNDVDASVPRNLSIISGPNMSGKSTYLKQIVLLHIMAQLGCFVPAKRATFRITNFMFCKIAVRDDIECNASTFALEMKEVQYVLRSVTPTSLIVLDELCKGTAVEEGASIAWAICEKLLATAAFTFAATHFSYLTKLTDIYSNVTNHHFETINSRGAAAAGGHCRLTYTHRLRRDVAPIDDYGIGLAELSGLPNSVTEKARKFSSERVGSRAEFSCNAWEKTYYDVVLDLYDRLESDKSDREEINLLADCLVKRWKQKYDENSTRWGGIATNESKSHTEKTGENDRLKCTASNAARTRKSFNSTRDRSEYDTTTCSHVDQEQVAALSSQNARNEGSRGTLRVRGDSTESSSSLSLHLAESERVARKSANAQTGPECFECTLNRELEKLSSSVCSDLSKTVPSLSFGQKSPATQISISTMEQSMSKLYEYCLSDEDFQPNHFSQSSVLTDAMRANISSPERENVPN